jgi:hypothetical protein
MKTKHFFAVALITLGGIVAFLSCNNNDIIQGGDMNLGFDKNNLILEATAKSEVVQIRNAKDWANPEGWGVSSVLVTTNEGASEIENTFVVETDGNGSSWNVYVNPFVGEWFSIEKKGADIHIQLSENVGTDRELTIQINAAMYGCGEIRLIQKGK